MGYKSVFRDLFHNKVDAAGLAVFRIGYTIVLFCETFQLFKFRHLIYDDIPFTYTGDVDVTYIFVFWFVILAMLLFGFFTRAATIMNYIFGIIIFSSASQFDYHVFFAYIGINFLLIFLPVSRVFSIDSLIRKLKYTNIGAPFRIDRKVLEINFLVPVFMVIGLVYFDSFFRKLDSQMWLNGLGMWLPSSLPMIVWNDTSLILNNELLVKFLGYLVFAFEAAFLFLMWFKKLRLPLFILGVFFHVGILIAYPIPWFALMAVSVYLLMLPPSFWLYIGTKIKSSNKSYKFYYDAECPICAKIVAAISHFDIFSNIEVLTVQGYASEDPSLRGISEDELLINIHGVTANGRVFKGYDAYIALLKHLRYTYPLALLLQVPGISHLGQRLYRYIAGNRLTERCTLETCMLPVFSQPIPEGEDFLVKGWNRLQITRKFWKFTMLLFLIVQLLLIASAPVFMSRLGNSLPIRSFEKFAATIHSPFQKVFGVTAHSVFVYNIHFEGYNHLFRISCRTNNMHVPLLDNNGMASNSYLSGALWCNYTFRVAAPKLNREAYEQGVFRYLKYFADKHGLSESEYAIDVKEIETTDRWQKDFLRNQMNKPWKSAGSIHLLKDHAQFDWNPMMLDIFNAETPKHTR